MRFVSLVDLCRRNKLFYLVVSCAGPYHRWRDGHVRFEYTCQASNSLPLAYFRSKTMYSNSFDFWWGTICFLCGCTWFRVCNASANKMEVGNWEIYRRIFNFFIRALLACGDILFFREIADILTHVVPLKALSSELMEDIKLKITWRIFVEFCMLFCFLFLRSTHFLFATNTGLWSLKVWIGSLCSSSF